MTPEMTKRMVTLNAAIWTVATLASVILPFVTDSMTDGRSAFLRVLAQAAPLIGGMYISSVCLPRAASKAAG